MRLLRDTSGTFDQAKDPLQRDLVTLQQTCDSLQAQVTQSNKLIADIQDQLAALPITISPAGQVNGGNANSLHTVAHDSSLLGTGEAVHPLMVSSTWLAGNIPASGVTLLTVDINPFTNLNSTPQTLVAAAVGFVFLPIFAVWTASKAAGTGWTNGATSFFVAWDQIQGSPMTGTNLGLNSAGAVKNAAFVQSSIVSAWSALTNKPLICYTAANITGSSTAANVRLTLGYVKRAFTDF